MIKNYTHDWLLLVKKKKKKNSRRTLDCHFFFFFFLLLVAAYHASIRGLAQFIPITRFCADEHRARVDGRATARHFHGKIERAVLP